MTACDELADVIENAISYHCADGRNGMQITNAALAAADAVLTSVAAQIKAAVLAEREACAVIADEMRDNCGIDQDGNPYVDEAAHGFGSGVANFVGRAIRARNEIPD